MSPKGITPILFICLVIISLSCEKDDNNPSTGSEYEIPETYQFENVNYDGQLQRLSMLLEMKNYMRSANAGGVVLDEGRLLAMYANDAANAGWQQTYQDSKQLKSKTFENEQTKIEDFIGELALASQSTIPAVEGQPGIARSNDGAKQYLLAANGLEYAQIIEKGLMGACFYYQATAVYLGADKMGVDNSTVEPGEGTAMEHHWDEAFGYLGVPRDFPLSTDGLVFWGSYCNGRDEVLNTNERIMDAFLKGRAAISNGDLDTRDEAIGEVRRAWEEIAVGTALHYINAGIENFDDFAVRAHVLSEAIAFIYSLQFNPEKRLSNQEVAEILMLVGGAEEFAQMNLYQISLDDLLQARDDLAEAYDLMDMKENL